jgi:histidinol-phosphate aminotransferase
MVWRGRMAEALEQLGLRVTRSAANFLLVHFPAGVASNSESAAGKSAREADRFLHERRIILRRVEEYGFPDALRLTIGTEDENRAVLDALTEFMGKDT